MLAGKRKIQLKECTPDHLLNAVFIFVLKYLYALASTILIPFISLPFRGTLSIKYNLTRGRAIANQQLIELLPVHNCACNRFFYFNQSDPL
jgi:hypothetical protein